MLSNEIHEAVRVAIKDAMINGIPLATGLDSVGLLLTAERRRFIRDEVLNVLTAHVLAERPETLLRAHFGDSNPRTPAEVWTAVQAWLSRLLNEERTK